MPILKEKSEENFEAGEMLVDNGLYASSIHCFYYSSFQLSKHVLANYEGCDYDEQKTRFNGANSHNSLISFLKGKFTTDLEERAQLNILNENFSKLKNQRHDADYKELNVNEELAQSAKKMSEKINKILRIKYGI